MDFNVIHDEAMPVGAVDVKQSSDGIDGGKSQMATPVQSDVMAGGEQEGEWS